MDAVITILFFIVPWYLFFERPFRRKRKRIQVKNESFKILFLENRYDTLFGISDKKRKATIDIADPSMSIGGNWEIDVLGIGSKKSFYLTDEQLEVLINNTVLSLEELKMKYLDDTFSQLVNTIDEKYQKTILIISIERKIKQKKWKVYKVLKHNNTPGFARSMLGHLLLPLILTGSFGRKLHYQISDKELEAELKIAETKEKKKETVFKTKEEKTKCNDDSTVIELQEFLSITLDKYTYRSGSTIHNYIIKFDEKNIIISSTLTMPLSEDLSKNPLVSKMLGKPITSKYRVPLKEIVRLYFEEKKNTEWLIIETKPNKIDYIKKNGEVTSSTETQFILKKEFRKDNYNCLSSIIPAFHKIIITKCESNHSLSSIDSFKK